MIDIKIQRALISVFDKTGIVEFATELSKNNIQIISTGGTAKTLRNAGLQVIDVSEITNFPEMMDGRVKTLHPKIHGGLLGRLNNEEDLKTMQEYGISSIDLVVINLYPFEQTVQSAASHEEIIEQIDIGGPAMVRSSSKNYNFTAIVTSPNQYDIIKNELTQNNMTISPETRLWLASQAFAHTANYDTMIAKYFAEKIATIDINKNIAESSRTNPAENGLEPNFSGKLNITLKLEQPLRYGENPHQNAALYGGFTNIYHQLHGKELSYNNIIDIDATGRMAIEFDEPTCVIVKHTNPCGVASADTLQAAYQNAFQTDTVSPFGGIIAVNRVLDLYAATAMNGIFTEVIIAPDFTQEALELLTKKRDRRLIKVDYSLLKQALKNEYKSVTGGMLVQNYDSELFDKNKMQVVTKREPTEQEWNSMFFAWKVAKHVKSNAIVYASENRTLGIGAGQMSRLDSAITASRKAGLAGLDLAGCAVASEAFFPFADGLLEAARVGATAVIQPGGSVRDEEVIAAANDNNLSMIFTGMRHFKH